MTSFNKIPFLFAIVFLCSLSLFAQKTYYVTPDGTGQGNTWADAAGEINAVLFAADDGDRVWVAAGTYFPTTDADRKISFFIPQGVRVYGGFTGTETKQNQRDWKKNVTVLSGEINTAGAHDNSYNVVVFKNTDATTILDGFTITGGTGNGTGSTAARNRCGGGIYIDGSGKGREASPRIANCTLQNNVSRDGGAVYNNAIAGSTSPNFFNCQFFANAADFDGGAVFNDGRKGGESRPVFVDCIFRGNSANYGGGIMNYAGAGLCHPGFFDCDITGNTASREGNNIFYTAENGSYYPIFKDSRIRGNAAIDTRTRKSSQQYFSGVAVGE